MKAYDPEFFYFVDDVFLARPVEEIIEFCEMYAEFSLPFWFNTRSETCERETLAMLKDVGCYRVSYGIECGNEEFRQKVLRRKISNEELIRRFEVIAEAGIAFSLNVIIGMPGETRELVIDTIRLIKSISGFDALTVASSVLNMPRPYLSVSEIDGLAATFPLYCAFPEEEWPRIRRAEEPDQKGLEIREEYARIYRSEFLKEDQEQANKIVIKGATGCRTNPKDAFRVSPKHLTKDQLERLQLAM